MSDKGGVLMWVVAFAAACGLGFAILIGVGCMIGANACPFTDTPQQTTTRGEELFANNCSICHGRQGEGNDVGPSLITGASSQLSLEELQAKVSRGRPFKGMPRFKGELSEEQIESVSKYVVKLRGESVE